MAGPIGVKKQGIATTDVGSQFNLYVNVTTTLAVVLVATLLAVPFALFGMLITWAVWKLTRPTLSLIHI